LKKKLRVIWLVLLTAGAACAGNGQDYLARLLAPKEDTVFITAGHWVRIAQEVKFVKRDTFFVLKPDSEFEILNTSRAKSFYDSLEAKLKRRSWTAQLHHLLIRDAGAPAPSREEVMQQLRTAFIPYEGKEIGAVSFHKVAIFEGSVDDTTAIARSWLGKTLNTFHLDTRPGVLDRFVRFEAGDKVDPDRMADTERMLRSLSYIEDARLYLQPRPDNPDIVDVLIVTKDRFSIGVEGSAGGFDRFRGGVYDKNFLGRGIEMSHQMLYDADYKSPFGYHGELVLPSIGRSLVSAEVDYIYSEKVKELTLRMDRGFFTPDIKYGGGFDIAHTSRFRPQLASDGILIEFPYAGDYYDVWAGRSFELPNRKGVRSNLSFALRYVGVNFKDRPPVTANDNFFFHKRNFLLGNITLTHRRFYRSRNFTGFGDTEDIPTGFFAGLTAGYDHGEFRERPYLGIDIANGMWLGKAGYLGLHLTASAFLYDRHWEDGLVRIQGTYFSNLLRLQRFRFRQLVDVSYVSGLHRITPGDAVYFKHQLRNYPSPFPHGQSRLVLNLESVLFTPWNFYGFRTAFFTFADLGYLKERNALIAGSQFYSSFGVGVRLRNRSLVFQTLEFRLAYLPKVDNTTQHWVPDYTSRDPRMFLNLNPTKPQLPRFGEWTPEYRD
jgi:hypothetical protein